MHYDVIVEPEDGNAVERLARYRVRPPLGLQRMRWDEGADTVVYSRKAQGSQPGAEEHVDALDFLARVIAHIPAPKMHLARFYGRYSNVSRGRRRKARDPQLSIRDCKARERPSGTRQATKLTPPTRLLPRPSSLLGVLHPRVGKGSAYP